MVVLTTLSAVGIEGVCVCCNWRNWSVSSFLFQSCIRRDMGIICTTVYISYNNTKQCVVWYELKVQPSISGWLTFPTGELISDLDGETPSMTPFKTMCGYKSINIIGWDNCTTLQALLANECGLVIRANYGGMQRFVLDLFSQLVSVLTALECSDYCQLG